MINELLSEFFPDNNEKTKIPLVDVQSSKLNIQNSTQQQKIKKPDDSINSEQQKLIALLEKNSSKQDKNQKASKPSQNHTNSNKIPEFKPKQLNPVKQITNKNEVKPQKINHSSANKDQKQEKDKIIEKKLIQQSQQKQSLEKHEKIEKQIKSTSNIPILSNKPKLENIESKIIKQKQQAKPEQTQPKSSFVEKKQDEQNMQQNAMIQKKQSLFDKPDTKKTERNGESHKVSIQPMQKSLPSNEKRQLSQKEIEEEKLRQLLQGSQKKDKSKKTNKTSEKDKSQPQKSSSDKQKDLKKEKIMELQKKKPIPFSSSQKMKDLSQQNKNNIKPKVVNDEYDLSDSFINDSESVEADIDEAEVAKTLDLLQKKKKVGKYNNGDDSDIDEAGYEDMIKEEKKSRVIGLIEDLREEKYIKREKKIEEKQRKKLLEVRNKQELQTN